MQRSRLAVALLLTAALAPVAASQANATATLKGSTLKVTGGELADDLLVANFLVALGPSDGDGGGSEGDSVVLVPRNGTMVNGSTDPAIFDGVKKLKLNLEESADVVDFEDFSFGGQLTLRGGDGDDAVTFLNCNLGVVKLFGDANDDTFDVQGSNLGVTKVVGSTGVLSLPASGGSFESLNVVGGPGPDVMTWTGTNVNVNLTVNLSFGDDLVSFDDVSIGEDTKLKLSLGENNVICGGGSQFGALLSYTGAAGGDTLDFSDSQIGETLNIKLGPGANSVTLASVANNMQVGESIIVKGGPQDDTITFSDANGPAFPGFGAGGGVKLVLATGVNSVTMTGFTQLADLSITTGALDDTISLDGGEVQDDLKILLAAGNNGVTINDTTIEDDLTITAGSGDDTVALTGTTTVLGTQKINLGGGNDTGP